MNYFLYLQPDGEIQEPQKKGLVRFIDYEKTDISPREFDNAPVAGNRALQIARFAKAADKGLQAGRATNQIENGKKIIKTTKLAGFPKGLMNIATYGERKFELGGEMNYFSFLKSGGSIHIKPENKGKFTETKKRTGKTTEELTHSKNPITRKRAIFAQNAKKWNHKK